MFPRKEQSKYERMLESELEDAIERLRFTDDIQSYVKGLAVVEQLHTMIDPKKSSSMSKETLVTVGANLLGIILIIKHENVNVITSKALSFVIRPR